MGGRWQRNGGNCRLGQIALATGRLGLLLPGVACSGVGESVSGGSVSGGGGVDCMSVGRSVETVGSVADGWLFLNRRLPWLPTHELVCEYAPRVEALRRVSLEQARNEGLGGRRHTDPPA